MVDQIIRPADLPNRASPNASEKIPVDNGSNVAGATVESIVLAGRPTASQAEAEAGTDAVKAMTPLTSRQGLISQIGVTIASKAQGDLASTAVQLGDLATVATTGDYDDLSNKPIIPPGLADGDKGDISVSSGGSLWKINKEFDTVADLIADVSLGYAGSGSAVSVVPGQIITAQVFRYEVAASDATDPWLVQTAGEVKLIPLRKGNEIWAEQFGIIARASVAEAVVADDDWGPHLNKAMKFINNYDETPADATAAYLARRNANQTVFNYRGIIRYKEMPDYPTGLIVPAGAVLRSQWMFFDRLVKSALFYDPVDKDTSALATLYYTKQMDDSYAIEFDYSQEALPIGTDFDNADLINGATLVSLECSVITAPGVLLGAWLVGCAGIESHSLSIGENTDGTSGAYCPKVAFLQACAWSAKHYNFHSISRVQGVVFGDSDYSSALYSPYIDRNGPTGTADEVPIYKGEYSEDGSAGVTTLGSKSVTLYSPTIEHWYTQVVADRRSDGAGPGSDIYIVNPHIESASAIHAFACVRSNLTIDGNVFASCIHPDTDANASIFHVQNCFQGQQSLTVNGLLPTFGDGSGRRLLTGINSEAVATFQRGNRDLAVYGRIGHAQYLLEFGHYISPGNDVYVYVGSGGSDQNYGVNSARPVLTMQEAANRLKLLGGSGIIQLTSSLTITTDIDLRGISKLKLVVPSGMTLSYNSVRNLVREGDIEVIIEGRIETNATPFRMTESGSLRLFLNGCTIASLSGTGAYALVDFQVRSRAEVISRDSTINSLTTYGTGSGYGVLTVFVRGANRNTAADTTTADSTVVVAAKDFRN